MKNHTFRAIGTTMVLVLTALQSLAQSNYQPYTFTALAGGGGLSSPDVAGSAARFYNPNGVAVDSAGNVYVADQFNATIRKVTANGLVTTLAGLAGSFGSADGVGIAARFSPEQVAVDGAGNVYVADDSHTIRKVTPDGVVTTIAGLADSSGSANGTNSTARFNSPFGVAVDSAGNVYVTDQGNSTIRKVAPVGTNWVVTTLAGLALNPGSANGTNSTARFNFPQDLAVDSAGNVFVADTDNHTIREVKPVGTNWIVTTLVGRAGVPGVVDGTNSAARLREPKGLATDSAGNVYFGDNVYHTIRKVTPVGTNWVVTTLAGLAGNNGSVDGTGTAARFNAPWDVTVDSAGNVYVADGGNNMIRKVTPAGTNWVVTTLAGLGANFGSAEGTGIAALFRGPSSVTVDSTGSSYVADQVNHTIRKVTSAGEVTTLAGLAGYGGSTNGTNSVARFSAPSGVGVDGMGNVYVADSGNNTIRKITPAGLDWVVTTIAGLADPLGNGGSTDGTGSAARFFYPKGVATDSAGNVYVADALNSTIRKVTPAGVVTTLAGWAGFYDSADGTGNAARFFFPSGVAVDIATNVYVADTLNHTIRKVTPARVVTTLAGRAGISGSEDGMGNAARFNFPSGVAVDSAGNLYVADTYNNTIRKMTPMGTNWVVTTLGGIAGTFGEANGTGDAARFGNPNGVAVDSAGNIYVADFYFNTIRKGVAATTLFNFGFNGGQFSFDLTGPTGNLVVVEASTDLGNWQPLWTNTFAGALHFSDPQSGISSNRFYRAHVP